MTVLFNQAIVRLVVNYKLESKRYSVKRKRVIVGRKFGVIPVYGYKEFLYGIEGEMIMPVDEFRSKKFYIEDGKVYFKPHCVIHMVDRTSHDVYFEDTGSLWKYKDDLIKSVGDHINIEQK